MNIQTLQAFLITGISAFPLVSAFAENPVHVTAGNHVRAKSDIQLRGYIENLDCFGNFAHGRESLIKLRMRDLLKLLGLPESYNENAGDNEDIRTVLSFSGSSTLKKTKPGPEHWPLKIITWNFK